jgi:hypothetical protein
MMRKTLYSWMVIGTVAVTACSGTPDTPVSPSGVAPSAAAATADGASLKAKAPTGLSPNGAVIATLRPTLSFDNAVGLYYSVGYSYDLEVQDAGGGVVYARTIGESSGSSSHTLESDLSHSTTYWFHVRARLGDNSGAWSDYAMFRTFDRPVAAAAPSPGGGGGAGLPFPIPAACGPGDGDKFPCVAAIAALSAEWARCAGGSGVGCHRFTRQVVFALSQSDPNWQMIQAAPGGHACNCSGCGPSDGTMFREDTTVYAGRNVYDMIVGAGGPTPSLNWSFVGAPRNVDAPGSAPVCP